MLLTAACENVSEPSATGQQTQEEAIRADEDRVVHLYFSDKENSYLIAESRYLFSRNDPTTSGAQIIEALIKGPQKALEPTIPEHTKLEAFYLLPKGIAVVDMSAEIMENHPGGAKSELLTIYAIVNSLVLNINEIEAVKILIDGREVSTLAGHIDLRSPLRANMLLIR